MVERPVPPLSLPRPSGIAAVPGVRTLASARFRTVVAGTLLAVAVGVLGLTMVRQASDPQGQFAVDFADYHLAAQRMAAGASPYAPEMLAGPVPAQGQDRYRYPPVFAQVLGPTAGMALGTAASLWLIVQAAAIATAAWIAAGAGGAGRSLERLLWCGVAALLFLPAFDTLWKGNVSGIVALGVAMALVDGTAGGLALAGVTLLKLVPGTLGAAFAADRRGIAAALVGGAAITAVSVVLAPQAWADYLVVLPNLLAGSADEATNLAPWALVDRAGAPEALVAAARVGSLVGSLVCLAAAAVLVRRGAARLAAVALGTAAMLLLPAALWYHYLVALLPLVIAAWPSAGPRARAALAGSLVAVSFGVAALPLATIGAGVAVAAVLGVALRQGEAGHDTGLTPAGQG